MTQIHILTEEAATRLNVFKHYTRTKMIDYDFTKSAAIVERLKDIVVMIETSGKLEVIMKLYQEAFSLRIKFNKDMEACLTMIDKHSAKARRLARIQAFWAFFHRTFSV